MNLVKNGIALEKINIGGMGARPGRKTLYRNISASEEEMNQLKELTELGLAVEIPMRGGGYCHQCQKILIVRGRNHFDNFIISGIFNGYYLLSR